VKISQKLKLKINLAHGKGKVTVRKPFNHYSNCSRKSNICALNTVFWDTTEKTRKEKGKRKGKRQCTTVKALCMHIAALQVHMEIKEPQ